MFLSITLKISPMNQTAYQLNNEDGTTDRFIIETFSVNGKFVRAYHYQCAPGLWTPVKELSNHTIYHKRPVEDTQMLFHSKHRRCLIKSYGDRVQFNQTLSTIF